jgi:hypothetical protein
MRCEISIDRLEFRTRPEAEACCVDLKNFFDCGGTNWQSLKVEMSVDQVYDTRWDCPTAPEGVRRTEETRII